jgi:hypothetical protein
MSGAPRLYKTKTVDSKSSAEFRLFVVGFLQLISEKVHVEYVADSGTGLVEYVADSGTVLTCCPLSSSFHQRSLFTHLQYP